MLYGQNPLSGTIINVIKCIICVLNPNIETYNVGSRRGRTCVVFFPVCYTTNLR